MLITANITIKSSQNKKAKSGKDVGGIGLEENRKDGEPRLFAVPPIVFCFHWEPERSLLRDCTVISLIPTMIPL